MGAEGFYGLILITLFSSLPLFSSPLLFPSSLPLFSSPLPCMEYSKDDQDDHPTDRQIILSLTVFVILLLLLLYYYYKQVKKSLLENKLHVVSCGSWFFGVGWGGLGLWGGGGGVSGLLVFGCVSLVLGLWSLGGGSWSLLFGSWSLVLGL